MFPPRIAIAVTLMTVWLPHVARANTAVVNADARRGEQLFTEQGCSQCHTIRGKGGTTAPDLGRTIGRSYTPEGFVARMWNHAPSMWSAMEKRNQTRPELSPQNAADLLGYFYSVRFFDRPADAGRGKRLFQQKHCAECHQSSTGAARPVAEWQSVGNPIEFTAAMWNHASNMRDAFASRKISWPVLTGQEISDIALYARSIPSARGKSPAFRSSSDGAEALFESKGCAGCHVGKLALDRRLDRMTLNDVAAAMWSHAHNVGQKIPSLDASEMSELVSWLWSRQILTTRGNAAAGKNVFTAEGCSGCHTGGGDNAPSLASRKGSFSTVSMVSSLWQHGPRMLDRLKEKGMKWPTMTASEMADLIAYINAGQ